MEKESTRPIFEVLFILAGCFVYYLSHSNDFFGSLGGLLGMALGALVLGYIPYCFLKRKIRSALLKCFAVSFLLVNLLVLVAS